MKRLEKWIDLVENAPRLKENIHDAINQQALRLIDEGFRNQRDPYGKRWKRKRRPDGRPTLHGPTGRLRSGWHVVRGTAKELRSSVRYSIFHQQPDRPSTWLARRMMVPDPRRGLPRRWAVAFRSVSQKALINYFKRGSTVLTVLKGFRRGAL